ncbi:MAG: hypothetical protein CMI26_12785, partial [Opitutae bacterium]|nr:hypothetical protein [Opitutae bacterium]
QGERVSLDVSDSRNQEGEFTIQQGVRESPCLIATHWTHVCGLKRWGVGTMCTRWIEYRVHVVVVVREKGNLEFLRL